MGCDWSICWNLNTWDVFHMNQVQMSKRVVEKVESGRRVADAIKSLVNASGFQL